MAANVRYAEQFKQSFDKHADNELFDYFVEFLYFVDKLVIQKHHLIEEHANYNEQIAKLFAKPELATLAEIPLFKEYQAYMSVKTHEFFSRLGILPPRQRKRAHDKDEESHHAKHKPDDISSSDSEEEGVLHIDMERVDRTPDPSRPVTPTAPVDNSNSENTGARHRFFCEFPQGEHETYCEDISKIVGYRVACKYTGQLYMVLLKNDQKFREVQAYLKKKNIGCQTYDPKSQRPVKVMIKGIPHSTPKNEIEDYLTSMGYAPINIAFIRNRQKKLLPYCVVDLQRTANIEDIYSLDTYHYLQITVEKYHSNKVRQCHNCQGYGHSSYTCTLTPRCLKCAENHLFKDCKTKGKDPVKCANCLGPHVATYRGCPKNPRNKNSNQPTKPNPSSQAKAKSDLIKQKLNPFSDNAPPPGTAPWTLVGPNRKSNKTIYLPEQCTSDKPPLETMDVTASAQNNSLPSENSNSTIQENKVAHTEAPSTSKDNNLSIEPATWMNGYSEENRSARNLTHTKQIKKTKLTTKGKRPRRRTGKQTAPTSTTSLSSLIEVIQTIRELNEIVDIASLLRVLKNAIEAINTYTDPLDRASALILTILDNLKPRHDRSTK